MKYTYKAKKGIENIEGVLDAENSEQAIAKLEQMGYLPVKVEEEKQKAAQAAPKMKKISSKDLSIFIRQLASMVKSKVQLNRALELLSKETQNEQLKKVIRDVKDDVKQGKQFSESLAKYPKYFSRIHINMIAAGERGGVLEEILVRLVEFSEREEEMRSKVQGALVYPAFMAFVGVLSVFVMITFVMPKLIKLFTDLEQELPWATQMLISLSNFSRDYWYWVLLGAGMLGFIVKKLKLIEKNRMLIDQTFLRLPVIGKSIKHREIARFCRTLGLLLQNGIPIRDAIMTTVPTLANKALEKPLSAVGNDLALGVSVSKSLSKIPFFPGFVLSLISVGEEAGRLDEAFEEVAHSFEKELDAEIKVMSSLLEPLFILIIGLIVGFIVMAMLMPIFEMNLR